MPDRHAPFMVGWVRKYLAFGRPKDAVFSDVLERNGRDGGQTCQALESNRV